MLRNNMYLERSRSCYIMTSAPWTEQSSRWQILLRPDSRYVRLMLVRVIDVQRDLKLFWGRQRDVWPIENC